MKILTFLIFTLFMLQGCTGLIVGGVASTAVAIVKVPVKVGVAVVKAPFKVAGAIRGKDDSND